MRMEMSEKEFLESVANATTRKSYRIGINRFVEFYGKSVEEIVKERMENLTPRPEENPVEMKQRATKFERELEKFHSWLLEKGYSINSARVMCLGIQQLFRYYSMPLVKRSGSPTSKTVESTKNFPLTIEHVRKMFDVADLRERVVLSMASDLGLRISDFVKIKKGDLPNLDQESPIAFTMMTKKEDVPAYGYLSAESVELLKTYLPTIADQKNPCLFPSNGSHISDDRIGVWLKELGEKAGIETQGKQLTFHCFRKMFLSASADLGLLTVGKRLCGKSISKSDSAYLTVMKLREGFAKIKEQLTIQETTRPQNHQRIESLENAVSLLERENSALRGRVDILKKDYDEFYHGMAEWRTGLEEAFRKLEENTKQKKNP